MTINPLYSLTGFIVGTLVGLTGVGGGSLMTPILVLLFNFHPAAAVGTDLLYACVTKSVGSLVHGWKRSVDWAIVGWLALGSMPAAIGALMALKAMGPPSAAVVDPIKVTLGVMLFLTGLVLLFRDRITAWSRTHGQDRSPATTRNLTILLGVVVGVAVTITSGRGRRDRRDGAADPLSAHAARPDRRQRRRPCRAADAGGGHRPLVAGHGRHVAAGIAADRVDPRHHRRQPARLACARSGAPHDPGDDSDHRRAEPDPLILPRQSGRKPD